MYHKVGDLGKARLDGFRADCHKRIDVLQKHYEHLLLGFSELPEKPRNIPGLPPDFNIAKIQNYTAEAMEWIEEVRSLLLEIRVTHGTPTSAPSQPLAAPTNEDEQGDHHGLYSKRIQSSPLTTIAGLRSHLEAVKVDIDRLEGDMCIADFTILDDNKDGGIVGSGRRSLEEGECDPSPYCTPSPANRDGELVRAPSSTLRERSTRLAELDSLNRERTAKMAALETECSRLRTSNTQVRQAT
jgi:hypothetical protein